MQEGIPRKGSSLGKHLGPVWMPHLQGEPQVFILYDWLSWVALLGQVELGKELIPCLLFSVLKFPGVLNLLPLYQFLSGGTVHLLHNLFIYFVI